MTTPCTPALSLERRDEPAIITIPPTSDNYSMLHLDENGALELGGIRWLFPELDRARSTKAFAFGMTEKSTTRAGGTNKSANVKFGRL
jgi:hypothetical protein